MTLKIVVKFEGKLTGSCKNDMRNLTNFDQDTLDLQNWDFDGIFFIQSRKCMGFKFTEELYAITMKNNAEFEEELTCQFKIDMKSFTNFDRSTQKSQKFAFLWAASDQSI